MMQAEQPAEDRAPRQGSISLEPFEAAPPWTEPGLGCRSALWARDLWAGFVFNEGVWRKGPLELNVTLQDPDGHVSPAAVQFHAAWLYGLNVSFVEPGTPGALPIDFPETDPPLDDFGVPLVGLLDHDRFFVRYSATDVYRTQTHYGIKLWTAENADLILLHELGHALGLGHVAEPGNIMDNQAASLGVHACTSWILHHIHPVAVGWDLPAR